MGRLNKLQKFAEIFSYPNVFENFHYEKVNLLDENGEPLDMKGQWNQYFFKNNNPITLELACGRGEYTLALAEKYPDRNFIGVDIKGARIWRGATNALAQKLTNVAFLRVRIEIIEKFFAKNEVDEIWITFPDPFLRPSKSNRRLTSPYFLKAYKNILVNNGLVHLKTDDDTLFEFSLETIDAENEYDIEYQSNDVYAKPLEIHELEFKTYYEKMHLKNGKKIKYIKFKYNV